MKLYLKSKKINYNGIGEYNESTNEFIVYKGSVVSDDIKEFKGKNSIVNKRKKYVSNKTVTENIVFKSPSTAANFITGRSKNGLDCWKNEKGISIKEIKKK